jgi:integrase/recombinase XerD
MINQRKNQGGAVMDIQQSVVPVVSVKNLVRITDVIPRMVDEGYYHKLVEERREFERKGLSFFNQLHDLELIYYFVHDQQHIYAKHSRSDRTKREYLRDLLYFYDWCIRKVESTQSKNIFSKLSPVDIEVYQDELISRYSVATVARKVTVIKSFLKFLYKRQLLETPLYMEMKRATVRMKDRPNRDIEYEEMKQIVDYYKDHPILHALFSVLMTTGIRVEELCNARVCDLTYDRKRNEYWLRVIGKGNKERDVLIFPPIFERIVLFRKRRGLETILNAQDDSPLFTTNKGKKYSPKYLSRYLTEAIERTKLPFLSRIQGKVTPHWFRHGVAILLREAGADIREIQLYLGHESLRTTEIYLDRHIKKEKSAARKLSDISF